MTLITRVRFELPVPFDARILIGLCCEDLVWEDRRTLSGTLVGELANARLGGVLGERRDGAQQLNRRGVHRGRGGQG